MLDYFYATIRPRQEKSQCGTGRPHHRTEGTGAPRWTGRTRESEITACHPDSKGVNTRSYEGREIKGSIDPQT